MENCLKILFGDKSGPVFKDLKFTFRYKHCDFPQNQARTIDLKNKYKKCFNAISLSYLP